MADGTGAGYNIPISVSYARTETLNPILDAYTVFNFSSPWGSGGTNDIAARTTSEATATSSAAEGNAASATQASQAVTDATSPGKLPGWVPWAAGAGVVIALIILWRYRKSS